MPNLDKTGPEGQGRQTGRGLGKGNSLKTEEMLKKLGKGLGLRRHATGGEGQGKGKRLNYNKPKK
ncbi:MAG: DUF5320 domain-containing protein [Bacteroidetes bacterium]|nr:DUF5320 domain-containing protein [Bacteroidota bacterium]MBU1578177.1 DUF5320 domain-containing protein [Bacteroidota bacterium]MBU2466808.1 DUF5320 domain-containing protein [Bacteroidota bacterium]